ncbi:MAG: hypothetical protein LBK61_07965 [Spirochaetaceae bacterium]|jgi:hypothetical protein|nr:hypothetical protein [Spirochaetaceae bacterium]
MNEERAAEVEIAAMKARVAEWTSQDTLAKAKGGKSRDDIFREYDNTLQPIAYVSEQYLASFGSIPNDNRVYCGQAYFLDHAVNHHPEITPSDYSHLQEILSNPDEVIIDRRMDDRTRKERNNLLFTKKYGTNLIAVIGLEEGKDGKIILHKSLYGHKKTPYPSLPRVQGVSSGGGPSPIGRIAETIPGGNLSARDDSANINHFVRPANPSENTGPENDPGVYFQLTREGELEEARKAAVMPRKVSRIAEAQDAIRKLIKQNNSFTNKATNITAVISGKSISKLGFIKDEERVYPTAIHAQAVANIDKLFENAQLHITHNDRRNNPDIKQIHRFGTVMEYDGDYYPIKITVKEFHQEDNKLYSVEAVSIDETEKTDAGRTPPSNEFDENVQPPAAFYTRLSRLVENVKAFQTTPENDHAVYFQLTREGQLEGARKFPQAKI